MHSLYHLERLSRETPAERVRQAERDEVGRHARRARRARQTEAAKGSGWRGGWLALLGWAKSSARRRPSVEFDR